MSARFCKHSTGFVIQRDRKNTSRTIAPIIPAIMIRNVRINDFYVAVRSDWDTSTKASRLYSFWETFIR